MNKVKCICKCIDSFACSKKQRLLKRNHICWQSNIHGSLGPHTLLNRVNTSKVKIRPASKKNHDIYSLNT